MEYLIAVLIVGGIGWTEWRFRQLGRNRAGPSFQCYYCKELFPVFRRERLGHYDYCPEHGNRRKAEYLADLGDNLSANLTKEAPHDDRTWIHPTHRGSQQPDNDKLPWLS